MKSGPLCLDSAGGFTLSSFESALAQAGCSAAHEGEYSKFRLRVVEERLFRVSDDFPRLTTTISCGVPAGIEYVEYDITLASCGHSLIANSASAPIDLR